MRCVVALAVVMAFAARVVARPLQVKAASAVPKVALQVKVVSVVLLKVVAAPQRVEIVVASAARQRVKAAASPALLWKMRHRKKIRPEFDLA